MARKLTIGELGEILRQDGTQEAIEQAIRDKELTQEESDKIYAFLTADSKDEREKLFNDIWKNVVEIPTFDSPENIKDGWGQIRKDMLDTVTQLEEQKDFCQAQLDDCDRLIEHYSNEIELLMPKDGTISEDVQKEIDVVRGKLDEQYKKSEELTQKLDESTKRYEAYAMMFAHAKTASRQAQGKAWWENSGLKRGLDLAKQWNERRREIAELKKDITSDVKRAVKLTRMEKRDIKYDTRDTKKAIKDLNKTREKIDKKEKKLIKKVNALIKKENGQIKKENKRIASKQRILQHCPAWKRGEEIAEIAEIDVVRTVDQARQVLSDLEKSHRDHQGLEGLLYSKNMQDAQDLQTTLNDLKQAEPELQETITMNMEDVYHILRGRQRDIEYVAKRALENADRANLSTKDLDKIYERFEKGQQLPHQLDPRYLSYKGDAVREAFEKVVEEHER